ncbi:hypothetical protein GKR62_05085 [Yersinia pseudotuberculosis]|nr:hypothetical protein [Yersinia pseudotuberculosis]
MRGFFSPEYNDSILPDRQTDRPTDRQTDRPTDRQTDLQLSPLYSPYPPRHRYFVNHLHY